MGKNARKPAIIGTNRHNSGKQEFASELIKKIKHLSRSGSYKTRANTGRFHINFKFFLIASRAIYH